MSLSRREKVSVSLQLCLLAAPSAHYLCSHAHDPAHLSFFAVCVFGVRLVSVCFEARASLKPAAQQQPAAMPRVVPDQKNKYETDELFKKLSQDVDVSCTDVCMRLEMSQYACAPETSVCVCVCAGQVHGVQGQASGGEEEEVPGGSAGGTLCHCEQLRTHHKHQSLLSLSPDLHCHWGEPQPSVLWECLAG